MMSTKGHVLGSAVGSATATNLVTGSQPGAASSSGAAAAYQEFSVRVPKMDKPMSVMRFNGALNVDLAKWSTLKMIRDDHTTRKTVDHTSNFEQAEMPKFGAGSEYGREAREEARRRKYGQHKKKINADDHPWVLKATTTDKQAKRFKGIREGTISSNASYFVFTQATDGQFEVFPVSQWYNFTPVQTYKALSAEEAEEEFGRRDKIMNYFSVMVRKRMKGDEAEGIDKEEEKISKKKGRGGGGGLKVSEMEDWDDVNEMESDDDDEEDDSKDKKKKKAPNSKKKKKKGSDSEANEDSDDGDGEGRELDYISDSSMSSSDDEDGGAKKLDLPGVEQESGLRNLLESDSSEEEEKEEKPEEDAEAEAEKNKGKTSKKTKKGKKKPNEAQSSSAAENLSDGDSDSDDSEHVTNEAEAPAKSPVVVSPEKEKTPEVEVDAESRKRKLSPVTSPVAKKNKLEVSSVLLQTAASEGITEEAIRRYLLRKPMTVTGLLQKFKSKKTKVSSMSSEDMVTIIASILKKINPTKRNQNNKMYLFLKA